MTGNDAAYSYRSDFDSVSETPAPQNIDPGVGSEATDQVATPIEPEARNPEASETAEETAKASKVVKEPAAKKPEPSAKAPEPAPVDSKPQKKDSNTAGEKDSKPAEKDSKPAEKVAKPAEKVAKPAPKPKPQKPEDKPFPEFIDTLFLPAVVQQLKSHDITAERLERVEGDRPVVGGSCSMVIGELPGGRRFWLCFAKADINSQKVIALADRGSEPTLLESFLIDEKRMSLPLLVSRLLQRLNGQKWLGSN